MASEDFKQTGKIKFSDINDLTNNSITTGNIYASGTSANIGTSDNPFNSVYANQYYGRKFKYEILIYQNITNSTLGVGTTYSFNKNLSFQNFELLILGIHGPEYPTCVLTPFLINNYYSGSFANYLCIANIMNPTTYKLYIYFPSDTSVHITCPQTFITCSFYILGCN